MPLERPCKGALRFVRGEGPAGRIGSRGRPTKRRPRRLRPHVAGLGAGSRFPRGASNGQTSACSRRSRGRHRARRLHTRLDIRADPRWRWWRSPDADGVHRSTRLLASPVRRRRVAARDAFRAPRSSSPTSTLFIPLDTHRAARTSGPDRPRCSLVVPRCIHSGPRIPGPVRRQRSRAQCPRRPFLGDLLAPIRPCGSIAVRR